MNQQEILKKIGGIIAELKEQHTYIQASDNAFNELELELFMANANFLTDHIDILKKISGQQKQIAPPAPMPIIAFEDATTTLKPQTPDYFSEEEHSLSVEKADLNPENIVLPEVDEIETIEISAVEVVTQQVIILPETMPENVIEELPEVPDASFIVQKTAEPDLKLAEEIIPVSAEINIQTTAPPQQVFEIEPKNPIVEEPVQIKEHKTLVAEEVKPLTLNERIAAQKELKTAVVNQGSEKKTVQDLQSLISLNDKLLFIKELFNGYNLAYAEAINILNRYTTFDQAENFLKANYVIKNNWKDKPATTDRFYEILQKKYN